MTFPKNAEHTIDGGWCEITVTYEPTEIDDIGHDGVYVKSYRIKDWSWIGKVFPLIKEKMVE